MNNFSPEHSNNKKIQKVYLAEDMNEQGVLYSAGEPADYFYYYNDGVNNMEFSLRAEPTKGYFDITLKSIDHGYAILRDGNPEMFGQILKKVLNMLSDENVYVDRINFRFTGYQYTKEDITSTKQILSNNGIYNNYNTNDLFVMYLLELKNGRIKDASMKERAEELVRNEISTKHVTARRRIFWRVIKQTFEKELLSRKYRLLKGDGLTFDGLTLKISKD
jgi:hypothetical protein